MMEPVQLEAQAPEMRIRRLKNKNFQAHTYTHSLSGLNFFIDNNHHDDDNDDDDEDEDE